MKYSIRLDFNVEEIKRKRGLDEGGKVQEYMDSEAIRLMSPYTPKMDGALIDSVERLTKIGSGVIIQGGPSAPYGRKWYYNDAKFTGAPIRGKQWFEKMKRNGGSDSILKGVRRLIQDE